ncbi:hypothetical protein [Nocardia terpenica]|uniref:Uncharacterized protein n=1 Tax=Nocardia terpenica TaxID=455432 RepID=A0A6G9ZDE7_9NOCA|nr:hypothetical protein [Nocardia terpenica]QIS23460.1 hypothetical protein F6W96_39305 [Nocardia terpenica]
MTGALMIPAGLLAGVATLLRWHRWNADPAGTALTIALTALAARALLAVGPVGTFWNMLRGYTSIPTVDLPLVLRDGLAILCGYMLSRHAINSWGQPRNLVRVRMFWLVTTVTIGSVHAVGPIHQTHMGTIAVGAGAIPVLVTAMYLRPETGPQRRILIILHSAAITLVSASLYTILYVYTGIDKAGGYGPDLLEALGITLLAAEALATGFYRATRPHQ